MPAPRARPALSRIPLGRALIALGLVLVAINVASAVWDVREARERTERRAQRDFTNVTHLLAEQTAASLEAVDLILRAVRAKTAGEVAASVPRMRDDLARIPQIAALALLDAQGHVLAATSEPPALDAEVAGRALLTAHRDVRTDTLHLSGPYGAGAEGAQWRFLLSRRLNGPGGGFGGVVVAAVEVQSFDRLYGAIDLGDGGFITLLSDKGTLITRVPDPGNVRGRQFPGGRIIAGIRAGGVFEGWTESPITGERVLLAASVVRGFPLLVASGSSERAVLASWRDEAWQIFDRTLLTSAAMLALIALAAWGLARRERALASSGRRYQAMIEHSSDALVLTRPMAGGILYASPAMERVLGYSAADLRGREIMELVHPETLDTAIRLRAELLSTPGKVSVDELRMLHKDGSWRWVELTRKNLLEEASVRAVVMNFRDIDERKQA